MQKKLPQCKVLGYSKVINPFEVGLESHWMIRVFGQP